MHQLSGTAVVIKMFNRLNSLHRRAAKLMISDSSLTTDTKLRYLGLLPLKEKLMFNKAVIVFKAYKNLAPPYLKQLFICSNTHATSRFITLPKPRIYLFKTSFSFSGASLRILHSKFAPASVELVQGFLHPAHYEQQVCSKQANK